PPIYEITFLQCLSWTLVLSYHVMFWSILSDLRQQYKGHFKIRELSLPTSDWTASFTLDVPLSMVFYTLSVLGLGSAVFIRSQSGEIQSTDKKSAMKHCPGPPPYTGDDDGKLRLAVFGVILAVAFTIPVVTYIYLRLARKPFKWSPVFQ